jgi:uncharacterized protein (DUF2267 family)
LSVPRIVFPPRCSEEESRSSNRVETPVFQRPAKRSRSLDELLIEVSEELRLSRPVDSREAVRVVRAVLTRHVDAGQLAKVLSSLPEEIRDLAAAEATS